MKPLRIRNKEFTDSQIFKLANLGCTAAFAEYGLRSFSKNSISKKFDTLERKYKEAFKLPLSRSGYQRSKLFFGTEAKKLVRIHKRAYEVPIRFLVNPIASNTFNKIILSASIDKKVKDFVFKLNLDNEIKINDTSLTKTQKRELKFSIIWINWFLNRPAYKRPDARFLNYYFNKKELNQIENYRRNIGTVCNLKKSSVKKIERYQDPVSFIRLSSPQAAVLARSLTKANVTKLQRLYYIFKSLNVVQKDLQLFLPIYSILNTANYQTGIKLINKFFNIGYTRILHAEIFSDGFLDILRDEVLIKELNQRADF